jgi:hypothetical protein
MSVRCVNANGSPVSASNSCADTFFMRWPSSTIRQPSGADDADDDDEDAGCAAAVAEDAASGLGRL